MLTISIHEALATAPEAWSAWQQQQHLAEAIEEYGAQADSCARWGSYAYDTALWQQNAASWEYSSEFSPLPQGLLQDDADESTAPLDEEPDVEEWQAPKKLAVRADPGPKPMSLLTSPLRIPLPEPLTVGSEKSSLSKAPLTLPSQPSGVTFARAASATGSDDHLSSDAQEDVEFQMIELPPGLLDKSDGVVAASSGALLQRAPTAPEDFAPPGMNISKAEVGGSACTRIEWNVDDLCGRLLASTGRPLVSPSFAACGLANLRLMVTPDARGSVKSARSHERKGIYAAMIKKGPLYGSLKLKADCLECATVVRFNLLVGAVRVGPVSYDFSEQAIHGLDDVGIDWLKQIELNGSVRVGIEILEVRPVGEVESNPDQATNQVEPAQVARGGVGGNRRTGVAQSCRRAC